MSTPTPIPSALFDAAAAVTCGRWAVGVSGGADSVALLALLRERALGAGDLALHVVHLDHQTRDGESALDAGFVADLATRWGLPCTVATRAAIESTLAKPQANLSARYREARFALFRRVIADEHLQGVILAHHAGDQSETVFQRLLRGGSFVGLGGMAADRVVGRVRVLRPLLGVTTKELRAWLTQRGIAWREDASNRSPQYQRNRVRAALSHSPALADELLALGEACARLTRWTDAQAPRLPKEFLTTDLADVPELLAAHAARRWLTARGAAAGDVSSATVDRLLRMARDLASPPRCHFPGRLLVRRRRGVIWAGEK